MRCRVLAVVIGPRYRIRADRQPRDGSRHRRYRPAHRGSRPCAPRLRGSPVVSSRRLACTLGRLRARRRLARADARGACRLEPRRTRTASDRARPCGRCCGLPRRSLRRNGTRHPSRPCYLPALRDDRRSDDECVVCPRLGRRRDPAARRGQAAPRPRLRHRRGGHHARRHDRCAPPPGSPALLKR